MADKIPPGGAVESSAGKTADATDTDDTAAVPVYDLYGGRLSPAGDATPDLDSVLRVLCAADGAVWTDSWLKDAHPVLDE